MSQSALMVIPGSPVLSFLLIAIIVIIVMYFARKPFHRSIRAASRVMSNAMRMASMNVKLAEHKLAERNREVLIAEGLEFSERVVEREFERISTAVNRDLSGYPRTQKTMNELLTKVDEDFKESVNVPPSLPNWVTVINGVATIESPGDSMVANMLGEINRSLNENHKKALEEYRKASTTRHAILNKMLPYWRKMEGTLSDLSKSVAQLNERAATIDRYMDEFREIQKGTDKAVRRLSSSSLTQFFISGLIMLIAIGGAIINFNLIALPMSEMVGGGSYIGPFKTSDVAGLVIILVEISIGIFLMESLRITRLFPIIGSMDDKVRTRMIWITFTILVILASVESALAFMRDQIAADMAILRQSLSAGEGSGQAVGEGVANVIPMVGQMVMGFILPFALTFIAIPLESFVHSTRTVLGYIAQGALQATAFLLRLAGNLSFYLGRLVVNVYDFFIFPALWIEGVVIEGRGSTASEAMTNAAHSVGDTPSKKSRKTASEDTE